VTGNLSNLLAKNSVLGSHLHGEVKDWHKTVRSNIAQRCARIVGVRATENQVAANQLIKQRLV
jgi:hypothetical protein